MIHFRPKKSVFGSKKAHFERSRPENGPPSSRRGTYQKTEGIQSLPKDMGKLWSYWIGSVRGKTRGLDWRNVESNGVSGQKCSFWPQIHFFVTSSNFLSLSYMMDSKNAMFSCWARFTGGVWWPSRPIFGPKIFIVFLLHPYKSHFLWADGSDQIES